MSTAGARADKHEYITKSNTRHDMLFVDTATKSCMLYSIIYSYTNSITSIITTWKKLNFAGVELVQRLNGFCCPARLFNLEL